MEGDLSKEILRCVEFQREMEDGKVGGRRRSLEPGEGPRETRGTDYIFPKWPQHYFCSHMFFQNLVTPHEQVEPISSPLELGQVFDCSNTSSTVEVMLCDF